MEKKNDKEKDKKQMFQFFSKIAEMITALTNKTMDHVDPEKIVRAVNDAESEAMKNYDEMRNIIVNSTELNDQQKLQAIQAINKDMESHRVRAGKNIREHQAESADLVMKIFSGFLTAGISFAPEIIEKFKQIHQDDRFEIEAK